jgi:hypothetical protein
MADIAIPPGVIERVVEVLDPSRRTVPTATGT